MMKPIKQLPMALAFLALFLSFQASGTHTETNKMDATGLIVKDHTHPIHKPKNIKSVASAQTDDVAKLSTLNRSAPDGVKHRHLTR